MEPIIEIIYHANSVKITFDSIELARAAYDKASAALREYQRFKNDRAETVEIETEGGVATLKLEHMNAVLFSEPVAMEHHRKHLEIEKQLREMRADMGLPSKTTD